MFRARTVSVAKPSRSVATASVQPLGRMLSYAGQGPLVVCHGGPLNLSGSFHAISLVGRAETDNTLNLGFREPQGSEIQM